jgi:hypothetical protein
LRLAAAFEQRIPVTIELVLIVTHHDDRDRVVEVVVWSLIALNR